MSLLDKIKSQQSKPKEEKKERKKSGKLGKISDSKPKKKKEKKPKKKVKKKQKPKNSSIIGLFGRQGSGKTYSGASFIRNHKKMLYLDSQYKAHKTFDYAFPEVNYTHIDLDKHKHKPIKNYNTDIVIISYRRTDNINNTDKLKTIQTLKKKLPKLINLLKGGSFDVCVMDRLDSLRYYSKYEWLRQNPKRTKPRSYEWGEIEEIVQNILFPFINTCRKRNIDLILCYGIKDKYLKGEIVGSQEDAKAWLLGELDVEIWLSLDYWKYFIKHPIKPFWEYRDEDEYLSDYLFDKKFIKNNVDFKEFQDFKEERLMSSSERQKKKQRQSKLQKL